MVLRRVLRMQRAGQSGGSDRDSSDTASGFHRSLTRLGYHGPSRTQEEAGRLFGPQTSGHMKRSWRNLPPSSMTSPPAAITSVSSKSSSSAGSLPRSVHPSETRGLSEGGLHMGSGGEREDLTRDRGKESGDEHIFNNGGNYKHRDEILHGDLTRTKSEIHYQNNYASNILDHRQGKLVSKNQLILDDKGGSAIYENNADGNDFFGQRQYRLSHNSDAAVGIRHRRLVEPPRSLIDSHSKSDSSHVYDYQPHKLYPKPPSSISSSSGAERNSAVSDHRQHPYDRQNMTSVYDALHSNAYHGTGRMYPSQSLSSSYPSLFPHSGNHTVPASAVTPATHAHNQHQYPLPLSSPFSLSSVPSTASQNVYKDRVVSPSSYSSLLSRASSSSSAIYQPKSSDKASSFASSSLAHHSRNNPSQTLLKHLRPDSDNLTSSAPSWSLPSSSSSAVSTSFSEKLRQSGLESLNLERDSLAYPTVDVPPLYNYTEDVCSNCTWFLGNPLDMNGTSVDGGGAIYGGDLSTSSPQDLTPEEYKYWTILLVVFPLLTVFGNILVCMSVVKEKSLKTVTNYFICSLAVADIMVAVVVMPFAVYMEVCSAWTPFSEYCGTLIHLLFLM